LLTTLLLLAVVEVVLDKVWGVVRVLADFEQQLAFSDFLAA